MRNSERSIMLVDSSKFSCSSHVAYAPVQNLHTIITDSGIDSETLAQLKRSNARVICVNAEENYEESGRYSNIARIN